jgi:hypothetical protein
MKFRNADHKTVTNEVKEYRTTTAKWSIRDRTWVWLNVGFGFIFICNLQFKVFLVQNKILNKILNCSLVYICRMISNYVLKFKTTKCSLHLCIYVLSSLIVNVMNWVSGRNIKSSVVMSSQQFLKMIIKFSFNKCNISIFEKDIFIIFVKMWRRCLIFKREEWPTCSSVTWLDFKVKVTYTKYVSILFINIPWLHKYTKQLLQSIWLHK